MSRIQNLIQQCAPGGVEHKMLRDIGTWVGGITPSKSNARYWEGGTVPWATSMDISATSGADIRGRITRAALDETSLRLVPNPAVAVVMRSNVLRRFLPVGYIDIETTANQDLRLLTPHKGIDARYVYWALQAASERIRQSCVRTDGSMAAVNSKAFSDWRIPVPPPEVQREIVRLLDSYSAIRSDLDAALETEVDLRLRQKSHFRKALLGIDSVTADAANAHTLSKLVGFTNGKAHERLVVPDGSVALLTARYISTEGRSARWVNPEGALTPARAGDIAMVMSDLPDGRALARCFYVDEDEKYTANQRVCLLRVRDTEELSPRWLFHFLDRSPQLLAFDNGRDQTHLKKGQILDIRVPLPSFLEQEVATARLDALDATVTELVVRLEAERDACLKQYEYYRDNLLMFEKAAA